MPNFTLRPSRPEDGERAVAIWRAAVAASHDFLSEADRAAIDAEVAAFLPSAPMWLAVDGADYPLAFMLVDGEMIEALFVDPAYQGQGVGRALIEQAVLLGGGKRVDVNEGNPQALAFYRHLSFEVVGRSPFDAQGRALPLLHLQR